MKRSEALEYFEKYTWDKTDFAVKEVTRYQSDPGQATAYMLGRLEIIKQRNKTENELGSNFNIRDFHYQVLSQGSSPVTYLREHIDRYIRCVKGRMTGKICDYILNPKHEKAVPKGTPDEFSARPPWPARKFYV